MIPAGRTRARASGMPSRPAKTSRIDARRILQGEIDGFRSNRGRIGDEHGHVDAGAASDDQAVHVCARVIDLAQGLVCGGPAGVEFGTRRGISGDAGIGQGAGAETSETALVIVREVARMTSVLAPPMSVTMTLPGISMTMANPRNVRSASSSPERRRTSQPVSRRTVSRKAVPLEARRTASVATPTNPSAPSRLGDSGEAGESGEGGGDAIFGEDTGGGCSRAQANRVAGFVQDLDGTGCVETSDGHLDRVRTNIDCSDDRDIWL